MKNHNLKQFTKGIKNGIPIALGYLAVSFTLGIQAKKVGITAIQSAVASIGLLASAGEYIAFTLMGAGVGIATVVLMEMITNARYLLMSCVLSQKIDENTSLLKRMLMGYCITDEIFGAAISVPGKLNPFYVYGMGFIAAPMWTLGTVLGVELGSVLPARVVSALGVGLFGMFIACIIPECKKNKIVGFVVALSFILSYLSGEVLKYLKIAGKQVDGLKVIFLTVAIALGATILFPVKEGENE